MRRVAACLLFAAALTAGCREAVYTKATEHSANEVLLALLEAGVDAKKVPVDDKNFDVLVERDDLPRALGVLHERGLPRARTETLGELFRKDGLVSTPAEERVRYVYGVSQELEKTLQHIDGVVHGRVHIVIPANDPLSDVKRPSSASVFVKYRPPADPALLGPLVRSLVVRGIEGLDADHVSVAFVAAEQSAAARPLAYASWLGWKVEAAARPWLWLMLLLPLTALTLYGAVRGGFLKLKFGPAGRSDTKLLTVRRSSRSEARGLETRRERDHA